MVREQPLSFNCPLPDYFILWGKNEIISEINRILIINDQA
jgi:hypothetical protein